jgi:hypothetical protein
MPICSVSASSVRVSVAAHKETFGATPSGLRDWLGIVGASGFDPCRFLRQERALRDMMAARLTLGGGPA